MMLRTGRSMASSSAFTLLRLHYIAARVVRCAAMVHALEFTLFFRMSRIRPIDATANRLIAVQQLSLTCIDAARKLSSTGERVVPSHRIYGLGQRLESPRRG